LEDQIVQKCATEGGNTAFFDLTLIENDMIEDADDFVFNWFEDNLLSVAIIANLDNYESAGNEVIYASVEDAQGCTSVGVVTLNVGEVEANSTTIELCAGIDGTIDVNLSDYRDSINSSSIYAITWYTNAGLTNEVADISNVTINDGDIFYALVDDGDGCSNSGQATFDLVTPPSVFNGVYELCDGGSGSANFDLLSVEIDIAPFDYGNVNFQWCEDEDCFSEISDPGNYSSNGTTVYAHVGNGCNSVAQLDLQLGLLEASNTSITQCDKGDGTADFNLSSSDSIINADNNATVSWFTDAGLSSSVPDPTNYNSGTSTVYAEVNNGSCSTSVAVTLEIGTPVAISTEIQGCGSGTATFDLTSAELAVTDGGANEVKWFSDQGLTNEINNPASYSSAEGTVYAVVGDDDCNATASVTLTIDANPTANNVTINMEEEIDGQGVANFDIGAYTTDINGGTGGVVFYADGGVVGLVEVSADGGYSSTSTTLYAVVTSSNGCKDTAFVSLLVEGYEDTSGVIIDNGDDDSLIVVETPDTVVTPDGDTVIINPGDSVIVIGTEDTIITADGDTVIVSPGDTVLVEDGDTTVLSGGDDDLPTLSSPGNGSITLCGDGEGYATFNLSSIAGQIRGNSSAGIAWFLDESTTLSISNPTAYSTQSTRVYATVTGMEGVGYADLFVVSAGNVGVSAELSRCPKEDGGASAVFDLTSAEDAITQGSNLSIQWFEDEQGTAAISSPSNFESITTTVFAELTAAGGCSGMVAVYLVVEELVGVNSTMNTCDNGDSTGTFNLTMAEVNIGGGVGYEVTWYSDADRAIEITAPTSYTTAATTVYASIQVEGESSCSANAELTLSIGEIQVKHGTLRSCISTGLASFNLREVELFMSYGISYNVTWYTNVEMTDVIGSPTDYQSNIGRVYAKFYMNVADDECFGQGHVDLYIDNFQPQDTSFTFCGDNAIGLYYNLGKYENILTSNSYLDVTWHKRPNRLDPIENPSYYLPASYENGVHTIYAEVCENMAEVQLIVFERDSFSIATDANDIVIEAGDQVELGTSAGESFDHIWSPSNTLDDSTSANPVASPSTTTQYAVVISNDAGCEANDTVTVFVENPDDPLDEMIAKIFSPDGNGDNDELFVNGPGICEVNLRIYNRWGVLVFENANLEIGWNGGMDNDISKPAPADDYRYALRVKRCNTEDWMEEETGVITIIR
jgi:gliding motility-associated-like protein